MGLSERLSVFADCITSHIVVTVVLICLTAQTFSMIEIKFSQSAGIVINWTLSKDCELGYSQLKAGYLSLDRSPEEEEINGFVLITSTQVNRILFMQCSTTEN